MINISSRFKKSPELRNQVLKRYLALSCGVGFFVAITPDDVSHSAHSVGMGAVVGVTYFFGAIFLLELRARISPRVFITNMIILQGSVLTYAATYFADIDQKQIAQKICVVGLLLVMERAVTIGPEGFEWRTTLRSK